MPIADLIGYGARADVVNACEHALLSGKPAKDAPLLAGIEALETVLSEYPDDYAIAIIVAQAHMDMGWAWRGGRWDIEISAINREAFSPILTAQLIFLRPIKGFTQRLPPLRQQNVRNARAAVTTATKSQMPMRN